MRLRTPLPIAMSAWKGKWRGAWSGGAWNEDWQGSRAWKGAGGKKGKGGNKWGGGDEAADAAGEGATQSTHRILSRYQFSKAILKTAADADGSAFVSRRWTTSPSCRGNTSGGPCLRRTTTCSDDPG